MDDRLVGTVKAVENGNVANSKNTGVYGSSPVIQQLPGDIVLQNVISSENSREATYGGFKYRWSYDDYQRVLESRRRKYYRAGLRVFAMSMAFMFFAFFTVLAGILILSYADGVAKQEHYDSGADETSAGRKSSSNLKTLDMNSYVGLKQQDADGAETLTISEIAEKVRPSIVSIVVKGDVSSSDGTGFVVTKDGYIVTNYHVIQNGGNFQVYLYEGDDYNAKLIAYDELTDLAVLKISSGMFDESGNMKEFPAVIFGDSDTLNIGETVAAVGINGSVGTDGSSGTPAEGIVIAINRSAPVYDSTGKIVKTIQVIQTSANINSGNSGGPLINSRGEVIGINSSEFSNGYEGGGTALPATSVIPIINSLIVNGEIMTHPTDGAAQDRPCVGILCEEISEAVASIYRLPHGVVVRLIEQDSNAFAAGLEVGDIIVEFSGKRVGTTDDIQRLLYQCGVGDEVTLKIYRNGKYIDIAFSLDASK